MMDAHEKLDFLVQKWIFQQGWERLREIQCLAIEPILSGNTDVLISASTAAGKTEAFFLPAISSILNDQKGIGILYISPLKALINDQDRRLKSFADLLDLKVTPWHGDSAIGRKNKLKKNPSGIILITPESLESLLIREPGWLSAAFTHLKHIVIDEFHAFLGTERGHHLMSLLHRLEHLLLRLNNPIPRTALSATLGELESVPVQLRPNQSMPCKIIKESQASSSLKLQVKGYIQHQQNDEIEIESGYQVCNDIYNFCRGDSHLVFANSRKRTEFIATTLADLCEKYHVPNEFFPHHGSLSKEIREILEARLQKEHLPTTAICTMTLELGIDIGKVNSVIQVTAPNAISSLRQRMGRSGRRGGPGILRMLITEAEINENSNVVDHLRMELVQSLAMIRLLVCDKWFEPADSNLYHFSTLLHQILAVVAQWGGVRVDQIYNLLCKEGPFNKISVNQYKTLLTHMGSSDLITQLENGELVLGLTGEKITNHYTYYAVFKTPEEYRVVAGAKTLGTLPIDALVMKGQHIVFGGKRWKVEDVISEKKVILVERAKGGKPPRFGGDGMAIHDVVRQEMFRILHEGDYRIAVGDKKIDFADATAQLLFNESIDYFQKAQLSDKSLLQKGNKTYLFPWLGDKVVNTLVALFISKGYRAGSYAGVVEIENAQVIQIEEVLHHYARRGLPDAEILAQTVPERAIEKYDQFLPESLLNIGYAARTFEMVKTKRYIESLCFKLA